MATGAQPNAEPMPAKLPSKPMASAARVSLFARRIDIRLSSAAIDILFERAVVLSEGNLDGDRYFGSTMVTFDLARAVDLVSDACDPDTVERIRALISSDERIKDRARRLGAAEAQRCATAVLETPAVDLRVTSTGNHLHLDLDVEANVKRTKS